VEGGHADPPSEEAVRGLVTRLGATRLGEPDGASADQAGRPPAADASAELPDVDELPRAAPGGRSGGSDHDVFVSGHDSAASSGFLSCVSFGGLSADTTTATPSAVCSNSSLFDSFSAGWEGAAQSCDLLAVPRPPAPAFRAEEEVPPVPIVSDVDFGLRDAPVAPAAARTPGNPPAVAPGAGRPPLANGPHATIDVADGGGARAAGRPLTTLPSPTLPALLVFNPSSGRAGGATLEDTVRALTAAGLGSVIALPTVVGVDTTAATTAALRDGGPFGVVIAAGGDGTISAVAAGLLAYTGAWSRAASDGGSGGGAKPAGDGGVETAAGDSGSAALPPRIPLAVIPRGTANALAAALALPTTLDGAAAAAAVAAAATSVGIADAAAVASPASPRRAGAPPPPRVPLTAVRAVDVGTANGRPFLLLVGIGLEADVVAGARRSLKARLGTLAYVASSLSRGMSHTPWALSYTITTADGETAAGAVRAATAVTVANTAPWTSVMAAAEAPAGDGELATGDGVPDDGALDATAFTASAAGAPGTAAAVVGVGLAASAGTPAPRHVHTARVVRLLIDAAPPQKVVVDGEVAGTTPVHFGVLPGALLVAGVGAARRGGALATAAAGVSAAVGLTVEGVSKAVGGVVGGVAAVTRGMGGGLVAVGEKLQAAGGSPTAVSAATAEAVWVPEGGEEVA